MHRLRHPFPIQVTEAVVVVVVVRQQSAVSQTLVNESIAWKGGNSEERPPTSGTSHSESMKRYFN